MTAKGFTYSVTDDGGHLHSRYSAGHTEPRYTRAVVRYPGCSRAAVSFAARDDLAAAELASVQKWRVSEWHLTNGYAVPPGAKIGDMLYPLAKVYPVTATPGRG